MPRKSPSNQSEDPLTSSGQALRERAETSFRESQANDKKLLSPEETRRTLHELGVHQIELEMQNEELRRAQAELDTARERYFDLYDLAPVGYVTISEPGLILEANLTAATLLGVARGGLVSKPISRFILKEEQDTYYRLRKQLFATGSPQACDLRMVKGDGAAFWASLAATAAQDTGGQTVCRIVLSDISARKTQEEEHEQTARLIVLVNTPGDFRRRMAELTAHLQGWSGCEAVGIRLRDGDDYPYYETRGFPSRFVQLENHLCTYGADGSIQRDCKGDPVLECMCGNILCGRFDPTKPCFTVHGSFWSNNTTALLASTTDADRQARTRNRCNGEGYESVALVPLRTDQQVFGLLQFNDHRTNRFTPDLIAHFERMADSLAIALSRRQAEELLHESRWRMQSIIEGTHVGTWEWDVQTGKTVFNDEWARVIGYTLDELAPTSIKTWETLTHPDDLARSAEVLERHFVGTLPYYECECRMKHKDGHWLWILDRGRVITRTIDGRPLMMFGTHTDITERKLREEDQRQTQQLLEVSQRLAHIGSWQTELATGKLSWSDEMYRILGFPAASPVYLDQALSVFPPEELARFRQALAAAVRGDAPYSMDYTIVRHDGQTRVIHDQGEVVFDEHGAAVRMFGTTQDVTERRLAENTRRESEERYRRITKAITDYIYTVRLEDGHAAETRHGPGCLAVTGYGPEEFVADPFLWFRMVVPEDRAEVEAQSRRVLAGEDPPPIEHRITHKDGTMRWVRNTFVPHRDQHVALVGYDGLIQDITERKRIDEIQSFLARTGTGTQQEPFFNVLARYLALTLGMDFVCIDRLDGDGLTARSVAFWCDGHFEDNVAYALKDTPCGEVVGKTVCCFPASVRQFFPRDQVLEDLRAQSYVGVTLWSHTGKPIGLIAVIGRTPLANRSLAETTLKLVSIRAAGELERLEAEQTLRESENRWRSYVEHAPYGIFVTDERGRYVEVNPEATRVTGYSESELLARSIPDILAPESRQAGMENFAELARTGRMSVDLRYMTKLGELRWWMVAATKLSDTRYLGYAKDITLRKQAEEAMRKSQTELDLKQA